MSTKIFNGRIMRRCDIQTAYGRLLDAKTELEKVIETERHRLIVRDAVGKIDRHRWKLHANRPTTAPESPLFTAWSHAIDQEQEVRKTQRRNPVYDMHCEVHLLRHRSDVLCLVQAENSVVRKFMDSQPWLKDYSYWNNADQPEGVTDHDWDARGHAWELAIGERGRPIDRCLTFTMQPEADIWLAPAADTVLGLVPDDITRRNEIAYDAIITKRMNEDKPKGDLPSDHVSSYHRACAWLKTPEGADAHDAIKLRVDHAIRPITADDLRGVQPVAAEEGQ